MLTASSPSMAGAASSFPLVPTQVPSVSAKEEFLEEAAEFSAKILKEAGFETKIHSTGGCPVVT